MPLVVVVSTVSVSALGEACTQAIHCQQACPLSLHTLFSLPRDASSAADVMLRWHGGADGGEGLLVEPSRRVPSSCHPASRDTPHVSLNHHRRGTQQLWELHVPAFSGASQGDRPHRP
jgi:hypothetical protein